MLYGYIKEVVKESAVAEQYIVDVFNELTTQDIENISQQNISTFLCLQQLARKKLFLFIDTVNEQEIAANNTIHGNKLIDMMGQEQRHVFCEVHYHGKTTAQLATELNQSEDTIRQILRQSFTIIRKNRNDTTVHQ